MSKNTSTTYTPIVYVASIRNLACCEKAWLEKQFITWMQRCANKNMGDNQAFYPLASCNLPLQGGLGLVKRLVEPKCSSWYVAVLLPSSRLSACGVCLFTSEFSFKFAANDYMYFEIIFLLEDVKFTTHVLFNWNISMLINTCNILILLTFKCYMCIPVYNERKKNTNSYT